MLMTVPQAFALRDYGARLRVYVDGQDVTAFCFTADDREGWALLAVATRRANGLGAVLRTRRHQGRDVVDAMIVLGVVHFDYDLTPGTPCVLELDAQTGDVVRHDMERH